jgi:hypothetical protein
VTGQRFEDDRITTINEIIRKENIVYVAEYKNEGLCYLLFLILYEHLEWHQSYTNTKTGQQEGTYN